MCWYLAANFRIQSTPPRAWPNIDVSVFATADVLGVSKPIVEYVKSSSVSSIFASSIFTYS